LGHNTTPCPNRKFWTKEPVNFEGNKVFQRNDLFNNNLISTWTKGGKIKKGTSIQRMADGLAPKGIDGKSVELHHLTQEPEGSIIELTYFLHKKNFKMLHILVDIKGNRIPSKINRSTFNAWKIRYWKERAKGF